MTDVVRGSAREVTQDAYLDQSEEEQEFLHGVAESLIAMVPEKGEVAAAEWLRYQFLDLEETLALWFLLPSNIRAAVKRGQREIRL